MDILFAIQEAGTFAYLEPLFAKWQPGGRASETFNVVASADVRAFSRFRNFEGNLPLVDESEIDAQDFRLLVRSVSPGSAIEAAAQARAAETGAVSVALFDIWQKSFGQAPLGVDYGFVIDEEHRAELARAGLDGKIEIIGQPAWEQAGPLPDAPENHIAFIGQPIRKAYGRDLGYDEDDVWQMLREVYDDVRLTYVLHPGQDRAHVEKVSAGATLMDDAQAALHANGTVVSAFSSVLYDAWLGGRKTICLQPGRDDFPKCPLAQKSMILSASSKDDLRRVLQEKAQIGGLAENPFRGSTQKLETRLLEILSL